MLRRASRSTPPTGTLLRIEGGMIHAHVEGEGPALILLHGASGNLRDFTWDLVPRLARRYRVIAFDRPGLGHSDRLHDRGESPAEQARILDAAARELGVERAVIAGHSYGGAVALAWALDHPGRAAAVVSLGGAAMPWKGDLGAWYRYASSSLGGALLVPIVSALIPDRLTRRVVAEIFAPQPPPDGYWDHVGIDLTLRPGTLRSNVRQMTGLKRHLAAMAPRYPSLRQPVELLHGTADRIVPLAVHARPLAGLLPDATLTELPGVGHMPHHVDPDATIACIERAARRAGLN